MNVRLFELNYKTIHFLIFTFLDASELQMIM